MCRGCWEESGMPKLYDERVQDAVDAIDALYTKHCTGGALHIVTDDYNVKDHDLDHCEKKDSNDDLEVAAIAAFRALSERERLSALAIADGLWDPEQDSSEYE